MNDWREQGDYLKMLTITGSLSRLYSDSNIPYIHYRVTENLFCKYCNAVNISRDDSAYDAKIGTLGVGIKTFQLSKGKSTEKVAECDKLSSQLSNLQGEELASRLAQFRNERMTSANKLYGITQSTYHIIGRTAGQLEVFNTPYDFVDEASIKVTKDDGRMLHFEDKRHYYSFSRSKSVLMMQFTAPEDRMILPISIIDDPYALCENLLKGSLPSWQTDGKTPLPSLVFPLYSVKRGKWHRKKYVPQKSGLNGWNAGGRRRDLNEVYVAVPKDVHRNSPDFFPDRQTPFTLHLPDGKTTMSAKICQANGKALMSNPNKALGEWLLRKVLRLKERELLTYERLLEAGFDSLRITKMDDGNYSVDVAEDSYSDEPYDYAD